MLILPRFATDLDRSHYNCVLQQGKFVSRFPVYMLIPPRFATDLDRSHYNCVLQQRKFVSRFPVYMLTLARFVRCLARRRERRPRGVRREGHAGSDWLSRN